MPIIRNYIESRIQKALLEQDIGKIRLWLSIAGNSSLKTQTGNSLLQMSFLNKKNLSQCAIEQSNELLKQYRHYPKKSPWYRRLQVFLGFTTPEKLYLFPAQTAVKNLLQLESTIEQSTPKPNLWARFVAWVSKQLSVDFDFTSEALTLEKAAQMLSEQGILAVEGENTTARVKKANFPTSLKRLNKDSLTESLSEQHSPAELLLKPKLIQRRLGISIPSRNIKTAKSGSLPAHLTHLVGQAKTTQVIAVDQLQQQQQQMTQHVDLASKKLLQQVQQQIKHYVDNSEQNDLNERFIQRAQIIKSDLAQWLENYTRELIEVKGLPPFSKRNLKISQKAQEVLERGAMVFKFSYQEDIDLNQLPLGFFIDCESTGFRDKIYVLKFSDELRKDQLKDPLNNFRSDPASVDKEPESTKGKEDLESLKKAYDALTAKGIAPQTLLPSLQKQLQHQDKETLESLQKAFAAALSAKDIPPSLERLQTLLEHAQHHMAPLDVFTGSGDTKQRYQTVLPSLYKQLQRIVHQVEPKHFLSLLIQFEKLNQIPSTQYCNWLYGDKLFKAKRCTLLDHFLGAYFPDNETQAEIIGNELCQEETLGLLNHLTHPDNQMAQRFFAALINSRPHMLFHKAYHAAMAAQEHFMALSIPVSEDLLKSIAADGCQRLENMINLSSASSVPALQIQLALANETPSNTVLCSRLLNQGYSFVVDCMDLSRYSGYVKKKHGLGMIRSFDEFEVPMCVDTSYLTNLNFGTLKEPFSAYYRNPYFIAWFRYLAYQVDPNHIQAAITVWRKHMGTESLTINDARYQHDIKNLEKHWEHLKKYILALPKKIPQYRDEAQMGLAEKAKGAGLLNEQISAQSAQNEHTKHNYSLEDAKTLCNDRLKLPAKDIKFVLDVLTQCNTLAPDYRKLSHDELVSRVKAFKKQNLKAEPQKIGELLSLLRELNYRWTTAVSKAVPPRGEWLRMEQALVILLTQVEPGTLFQVDTSEGKTLIIGMSALMHALQGSKTNIYTHNEIFANEAFDKVAPLAQLFDLNVADKKSSKDDQIAADILCMDISTAVINRTLDQYAGNPIREADVDLSDEIDNQIDIQAKTTMQISATQQTDQSAQKDLESYLVAFAAAFELLKEKTELNSLEKQLEFIQGQLKEQVPQSKYLDNGSIKFWLAAMVAAALKEKNKDFIIENKNIRIVHHTTTGRVDRESIWGEGVHQCVAALERKNKPDLIIDPLSQIVAEGNIAGFYKSGKQRRYAFTGSTGDAKFSKKIADVLGTERQITMPRAQRPEVENAQWPLIADGKGKYHKQYNRAYRFAPIITENDPQHLDVLLDMVATIRQNNQSATLFFNTIAECEAFQKILHMAETPGYVQIFDDTAPADEDPSKTDTGFKKTQKTAILHAARPGMITLTTAAGSRGADFKNVSVGIIAAPGLSRVVQQKAGRIARDIDFGTVYEVYSKEQLDEPTRQLFSQVQVGVKDKPSMPFERANLRYGLDKMEVAMQERDLQHLTAREPLDDFKSQVQKEYAALGHKSAQWSTFFASIQPGKDIKALKECWSKVKHEIEEEKKSASRKV